MNSHFSRVLQGMTSEHFGAGLGRKLYELHSNVTSAGVRNAFRTAQRARKHHPEDHCPRGRMP